ncbi:MFS general substrate transporter [Thozetella sp. PMI_491]|nr:MFS general substrate transporter [Thozetella sp. PMI_491]
MVNAQTWGINSSWAIFLAHYTTNNTFPGATELQYALIGGLSISQALMISPITTSVQSAIGMRWTMILGSVIIFVALFTSSYTTHIWQLFLSQGLSFGWGMGFVYIPASAALPAWFSTKRSLAVGIATSGAGIGGLVYSLVTNAAIQRLGVPWTYRILATAALTSNLVSSLLHREFRREGAQPTPREKFGIQLAEFRRIEVLLIVFWGLATELGYITLLYSLPSFASAIGLTPTEGSIANALLNLGLGLGRPLMGHISDRLGRINMALFMTALCGFWCFVLWIPARGLAMLSAFALLAGAICGTFWATITPVLMEVVGISRFIRVFGVICLSMVLPTTFAEPVAMQLVDVNHGGTGSFLKAQIFVGCMFFAGALSLWLLRAWKIAFEEATVTPLIRTPAEREDDPMANASRLTTMPKQPSRLWITPRTLFSTRRV